MYDVLNSYLFLHKSLSIPGLGTVHLENQPARLDQATKCLIPPQYSFRFDKYFDAPDREFFSYLATQKGVEDYEAIKLYTEFSFELRDKINQDNKVTWHGVGDLKRDEEGNIILLASAGDPFFMQPVDARKVVRPDAKHLLLVGDTQRTNVEMNEWLRGDEFNAQAAGHQKETWWIYALVLAILASFLLMFHFSSRGWQTETLGNQQTIHVEK